MTQPTVFISYSHKDEAEKNALMIHLGVLQSHGLIELWNDDRIVAGDDWAGDISDAMAGARVAILLVTANFLTSNFILSQELPTLLKRRRDEGLTVFPIIAKPCAWANVKWLTNMNVRPKNGTPVWRDGGIYVDEELSKIAMEVAAILERASKKPTPPPAPGLDLAELTASRTSTSAPAAVSNPPATSEARPQSLTSFQQRRLSDLQRNLEQDYQLLQEYEDLIRFEDDPRRLMRYRREIERQKAAIASYQQQLADILPDAATRSEATPDQIQQTLSALQSQIATLEARLLAGQQGLSEQMSKPILSHIDTRHREMIERVTVQLEADQLETVELLYDLVDQQQVAQWELDEITTLVQRSLVKLKDMPNAAYWQQLLAAAEGSEAVDQKLKLMLPLIPCLLEYELELRADTLPALQKVWQRLRAKVKG